MKTIIQKNVEVGAAHFNHLKDLLLQNIEETFRRDSLGSDASSSLKSKSPEIRPEGKSGKTMHDTEGWKSLETSMRIL